MRIAICLVLTLAAASACKKKDKEKAEPTTTETGSGSAGSDTMAGSGGTMAASGSAGSAAMAGSGSADAGALAHHAGNCPSTVADATTTAELKDKSVVVTVVSDNKDAQLAIQKRADELVADKKSATGSGGHDRKGGHGGGGGICPVDIPPGATADAKHTDKGVAITITPKDHVDDLKKEIDERIPKAAEWVKQNIKSDARGNQGGTGGGKAEEGMNRSGSGDGKGMERKKDGGGGGKGTGGGGGKGTGGGGGKADKTDLSGRP